jgi:hypothetical protein
MEFDSTFYSMKKEKYISHLSSATIALIERYAVFYAVEQDQVVNTALGRFFAADGPFVEYLGQLRSKEPPKNI